VALNSVAAIDSILPELGEQSMLLSVIKDSALAKTSGATFENSNRHSARRTPRTTRSLFFLYRRFVGLLLAPRLYQQQRLTLGLLVQGGNKDSSPPGNL